MKKMATLWKYFFEQVAKTMTSVGAVSSPESWVRYRWLLQTVHGPYELTVHNPELSDSYTFAVFGRFQGDGPYPAAANQHSGKLNFHLLGPETKITRADIDDFVGRMKGRLEAMLPLTMENPATGGTKFTLRVERTGYGDMVTASAGGKVFYGGDPNLERDLIELKERVRQFHPGATFVWAKAGRLDPEVQADLDTDDRRRNPGALPRKNPHIDPVLLTKDGVLRLAETENELASFRSRGWREATSKLHTKLNRLRVLDANGWAELTDRPFTEKELGDALRNVERQNPAERLRIGDVVMGVQGVDGGYVGVIESFSADHSGKPIVSFRGEDGVLRETYLFNVTKNVPSSGKFPRKNPAVTGERGQYRLHYMEPGTRKGTFRQAIRRVDSVAEAERWMNDNSDRAFLPASVMTPGNRWQSPDVVAILGPDRIPAAATATSYERLPV